MSSTVSVMSVRFGRVFFFKQKTAYEMRISDWSSDVCSSDLPTGRAWNAAAWCANRRRTRCCTISLRDCRKSYASGTTDLWRYYAPLITTWVTIASIRSEEHTSELQSLMRISYAVFCLKTKNNKQITHLNILSTAPHITHQ